MTCLSIVSIIVPLTPLLDIYSSSLSISLSPIVFHTSRGPPMHLYSESLGILHLSITTRLKCTSTITCNDTYIHSASSSSPPPGYLLASETVKRQELYVEIGLSHIMDHFVGYHGRQFVAGSSRSKPEFETRPRVRLPLF